MLVPCCVLHVQIRPRPLRVLRMFMHRGSGFLLHEMYCLIIFYFVFFTATIQKNNFIFKNKSFTLHHLSLSYITYKNKIVFILRAKRLDECAFKNTLLKKLLTKIITNNGGCFGKYNYIIHRERVSA